MGELDRGLIDHGFVNAIFDVEVNNFSLLGDHGLGTILFLAYHQSYYNVDHSKKIELIFQNLSDRLSKQNIEYDFGSGLAGFAWLISHLKKNKFIDIEVDDFLLEADEIIGEKGLRDLKNNHHDFFFGGLGAMFYLLERVSEKKKSSNNLTKLVDALKYNSINEGSGCYWLTTHNRLTEIVNPSIINGMAHGQASKVWILTQLLSLNISKELVYDMLMRSLEFLLVHTKRIINEIKSSVGNSKRFSTYGHSIHPWCNGDLGIASALWQAGYILGDEGIMTEAKNIFLQSCTKDGEELFEVWDAGLCHGSTGIAVMYDRMYKNTKNELLLNESRKWLKKTMEFRSFEDGICGFKKKVFDPEINWENDSGLLNGTSGIALGLISCNSKNDYNWDRSLLLC